MKTHAASEHLSEYGACLRRRRPVRCWWLVLVLVLAGRGVAAGAEPKPVAPAEPGAFNLIFSSRMFTEVHENDAKAALIAWAEVVMRERHLRFTPEPQVLDGVPALVRAASSGENNFITVSTEEYLEMGMPAARDSFIVGLTAGDPFVTYLLLVNTDSEIRDVAGLKGRTVLVYDNPRASLAAYWLDDLLLERGLPPAGTYCGVVNKARKLSAAVLPVFFHQADACLVTRDGLAVLGELNPQVVSQLRVLGTSPPFTPSVAFIRAGTEPAFKGVDLFREVKLLHTSAPGKQLLSLFKVDRLVTLPTSAIGSARELIETHRRLLRQGKPGALRAGRHGALVSGAVGPGSSAEGGQ